MGDDEKEGTVRQKILELIKTRPFDAGGLSRALGIRQREVEAHLPHVIKSARSSGLTVVIDSPRCSECDFVFKERQRANKPSRCPRCKCEHIVAATFCVG